MGKKKYLIRDYSLVTKENINDFNFSNLKEYWVDKRKLMKVLDEIFWDLTEHGRNARTKFIAVYNENGECLLDWS